MRIISLLCFFLICCTGLIASADEAVCPARPGACEQCPVHHCAAVQCPARQCPARQCPGQPCPGQPCPGEAYLSPAADGPIELEIRVLEINRTKLKSLGFDFQSFADLPSARRRPDLVPGLTLSAKSSGFVGFVSALGREGLVQQDVVLSHSMADGQSWDTVLRWHQQDAGGKKDIWRRMRLRVTPTALAAGAIRLEGACGAEFSVREPGPSRPSMRPPVELIDFGAELADQTLCLVPTFVGADPDQFPKDQIYVFVLITSHRQSTPEKDSENKSCPDLLAPRNVLNRRA